MESFLEEMLGGGEAADRVRDLWNEYEAGQTPEAKFVKDLDRLELCLQTVEYERRESSVSSRSRPIFNVRSLIRLLWTSSPQVTRITTSPRSTLDQSRTFVILLSRSGPQTSWPSARLCSRSGARSRRRRSRTGSGTSTVSSLPSGQRSLSLTASKVSMAER